MSEFDLFYTSSQQRLQKRFGTEKLARSVHSAIVFDTVEGPNAAFIESRDFFFLASVDEQGRPTVSYKGGPPGVCHVADPKTLVFPAYDGNGMMKSLGNIDGTGNVGLLFIDFTTPNRVRVQGKARLSTETPWRGRWPGAIAAVHVDVETCFLNCARYIHKHRRVESSPYVPDERGQQPHPSWKRIDFLQDSLGEDDRRKTETEGGTITMDDYAEKLLDGQS